MKLNELCKELGVEYNNRNPKRSLKEIEKQYEIGTTPNKKKDYYIIRKLSPIEQRQYKSNVKMREVFKQSVCATLSLVDGNTIVGSIKDFYELFAIVNQNYNWFKYTNIDKDKEDYLLAHHINMDNICIYHEFSKEIDVMFRRMVKDTLQALEEESIIYVNRRLTFVYKNDKGYIVSKYANDEGIKKMLEVGRRVLDKYGYDNYVDVGFGDKENIKNEVSKELGIEYFYNRYEIVLNKEYLNNNYRDIRNQVNELSIKKISNSTQGVLKEYDVDLLNDCIETIVKI